MTRIALGNDVRCFITEIAGKATVISEELNGNRRICVQQPVKDGVLPESYFHDEHEIDLVGPGAADRAIPAPEGVIKLGVEYRDRVSGFIGIATARNTYLSGCLRFTLTAKTKGGMLNKIVGGLGQPETLLVPHEQLEPVRPEAPKPEVSVPQARTGGPLTRSGAMRRA